jgi:hypothetical protein
MTPVQLAALSNTQIQSLSPTVIASFAPEQFVALLPRISLLSNTQISKINYQTIDSFTPSQLQQLSTNQIASILPETLAMTNSNTKRMLYALSPTPDGMLINWNQAQLESLQTHDGLTIDLIKQKSINTRYSYSISSMSRDFIYAKYWDSVRVNGVSEDSYYAYRVFKNYHDYAKYTRRMYQGVRFIGSILLMGSAISAFKESSSSYESPIEKTGTILQGIAWFATSLKVPAQIIYKIYATFQREYERILDVQVQGNLTVTDRVGLAWETTKTEFAEELGLLELKSYFAFLKQRGQIAPEPADPVAVEPDPVAFALAAVPPLEDPESFNSEVLRGPEPTTPAEAEAVVNQLADIRLRVDGRAIDKQSVRHRWAHGGAINLLANTAGVVSNIGQITVASYNKDPITQGIGITFNVLQAIGSIMVLTAELAPAIWKQTPVLMNRSFSLLRMGQAITFAASTAYDITLSFLAMIRNNTPGTALTAVGSIVSAGINVGLLLVSALSPTPLTVLFVALAGLFLPNWSALGSLLDIANLIDRLTQQNRIIERDYIVRPLYDYASTAATPIYGTFAADLEETLNAIMISMNETTERGVTRLSEALAESYEYSISGNNPNISTWGPTLIATLRGYITSSANLDKKIISTRIISGDAALARDYYAEESENDRLHSYIIDLHVLADNYFILGYDSIIVLNDIAGATTNDYELVKISASEKFGFISDSDVEEETKIPLYVDARTSSTNRKYSINSDHIKILSGTGYNDFLINADNVTFNHSEIIALNAEKNSVFFIGSENTTTTINMDSIINAIVSSSSGITHATGINSDKILYAASLTNQITLTGGRATITCGGRGNTIITGKGSNVVNVVLGWYISDQRTGIIDGGTFTEDNIFHELDNLINFSAAISAVTMEINQNNPHNYAKITDEMNRTVDDVHFINFQKITGSNFGDTINISNTNNIALFQLGLGYNVVSVVDTTDLNIFSYAGTHNIILHASSSAMLNNTFINTLGGENHIVCQDNTYLEANLGGIHDTVDFTTSSTAQLHSITTRSGRHTILLNQACTGIIDMHFADNNNHTIIDDSRIADSRGVNNIITLRTASSMSNLLINYDNNDEVIRIYSNDNSNQQLDYYSKNMSSSRSNHVYIDMLNDQDNRMYAIDTSRLLEAMSTIGYEHRVNTSYQGQSIQAFNMTDVYTTIQNLVS